MTHEHFIPNSELFGGLWPNDRANWPANWTAVFDGYDRGFCADVKETPDRFSWCGVPGTCYKVNAFLPSEQWYENAAEKFANWHLAVFAPKKIDPEKPIVIHYSGMGQDYSGAEFNVPLVVNHLGCILAVYETPMTGARNLVGDYVSLDRNINAFCPGYSSNPFGNKEFSSATREISFNARQVVEFVARRYGLPHRRFVAMGFSLGGYYSSQIALSQPNCLGCAVGCGLLEISDYDPFIPRLPLPKLPDIFRPLMSSTMASLAAIVSVKNNAYALEEAREGQRFYLNVGDCDQIAPLPAKNEARYRARLESKGALFSASHYQHGHDPFTVPGRTEDLWNNVPCVATGMKQSLLELTSMR